MDAISGPGPGQRTMFLAEAWLELDEEFPADLPGEEEMAEMMRHETRRWRILDALRFVPLGMLAVLYVWWWFQ